MGDTKPVYVVRCPECETKVEKDDIDAASQTAIKHDEARHDGQGVPTINGMPIPSDDLADAAEDLMEKLEGSA